MTDDLLVKYLLGEATTEEQALVTDWIEASAANRKHFEHFELIWSKSKQLATQSTVDESAAWERFKQRIETPATHTAKTIELPRPSFAWSRAASILLVVAVGSLLTWFLANREPNLITLQSGNQVLIDTLPDGSVITLNKESTLSYPAEFDGDTRSIALNGEAFFNVTPDKDKPFIITVNDVTVKVVGTSFNVKNTDEKTEVIVETGIVAVKKKENEVSVNPNEKAIVLKSAEAPIKENNDDALYNYYRTKEFVCNATPLWRLVDVLNDAYGVNIVISNPRLKNLELTTTFRNEPIENILAVVGETLNIHVERKGVDFILK
jgi:ferric-dicitrate binding protein FerR (iron transport regulator)